MIDRPLRFCMITTFYPPYSFGGDAIFVQALSRELALRGHHVEVIHCIDSYRLLAGAGASPAAGVEPAVVTHGLHSRFGPLSPLAMQQTGRPLFSARQIQSILDRGFDVIHYHNVSLVGGPHVLRMGRGVKLYTTHEFWLVCPMHVLFRDRSEVCTEPHCMACTLRHGRPPQWWRYTRLLNNALPSVDRFLAPSRFAIDMHRQRGLDLPFAHLPSFVALPAQPAPDRRLASRLANIQPYFLYVGRLEKIKGVQTLIPVFRAGRQARLVIAGAGSFEGELRRQAQGAPNISFLGRLAPAELSTLYTDALALIVPSLCYEVFPLVAIEAMAHGTPIIARRIGGLPEIVAESGAGLTYDDDLSLLSSMQALLRSPGLRADLGARARRSYGERWSPEAHLQGYLGIVSELLAQHGPSDGTAGARAPAA